MRSRGPWWWLGVVAIVGASCLTVPLGGVAQEPPPPSVENAPAGATRQFLAATALQDRQQYEQAAREWSAFLNSFPKDTRADQALHHRGVCLLLSDRPGPALESLQLAIADFPDSRLRESAELHCAIALFKLGRGGEQHQLQLAEQALTAWMEKYPRSPLLPRALFYRGETAYVAGDKAAAATWYQQLLREFPQDPRLPETLYALGVVQDELGQAAAAAATYDLFVKQHPRHALTAEVTLRRAELLFAEGKFLDAGKWFATAAEWPGFAAADRALLRQAETLEQQQQFREAAVLAATLADRFPASTLHDPARIVAGRNLLLAGQPAEARVALQNVTTQPAALEAAHWLARAALKEADADAALAIAESALATAAGTPWELILHWDRADAMYELPQRRVEAAQQYRQIFDRWPDDAQAARALYLASFASLAAGPPEPAIAQAEEFLAKFPNHVLDVEVYQVLAEGALLLKQYPRSHQLYSDLLKGHSAHAAVPTWQVRAALTLFLQQKYPETIESLLPVAENIREPALRAEAFWLLGASHQELSQWNDAATALDASLAASADWRQADEVLLALGNVRRQLNDFSVADTHFQRLLDQFPSSRWLDRARFRRAETLFAAGDLTAASQAYRELVELHADSELAPHGWLGLAWVALAEKQPDQALESLATLKQKYPEAVLPRAHYVTALAHFQQQDHPAAVTELNAFLATQAGGVERSDARYLLGVCQAALKQPEVAVAEFRQVLAEDPGYVAADKVLYEWAWALQAADQPAKATDVFLQLGRDHPQSPLAAEGFFQAAEQQFADKDFQQAATNYHAAKELAGKLPLAESATHQLAWSLFHQREFEQAAKWFAFQRTSFPEGEKLAAAGWMEAECRFELGKFKEALLLYEQWPLTEVTDVSERCALHAGIAAAHLEQWPKSLHLLQTAQERFPMGTLRAEILLAAARAHEQLKQTDQALPLLQQVMAMSTAEPAAEASYRIGTLQAASGDHAAAIESFLKAAYGFGYPRWQAASHLAAGRSHEALNQLPEALKSYQEVINRHPELPEVELAKQRIDALNKQ